MFEKYFDEFYVSEQELKEEIHSTLASLSFLDPDRWPPELLEHKGLQKSSQEFLLALKSSIPDLPIGRLNLEDFEAIELLRLSAIQLKLLLHGKELEYLVPRFFFMTCSNYFLGIRYLIAIAILSDKLKKEPIYDRDKIIAILTKDSFNAEKLPSVLIAAKAAQEEINRVLNDESADQFIKHVREFESAVEKYIKENFPLMLLESYIRLINEGVLKNMGIIDTKIQLEESFIPRELREWAEKAFKLARQSSSVRLGIRQGGKRERKGFAWTDEKKIDYFKAVESLPKTKNRSYWRFALDELIEHGFDADTVSWLKANPAFKGLPGSLFSQAVKVWRKYLDRENWGEMKREDSPLAFELRHALYLLEYPDKFAFRTLETRYYEGRKLGKSKKRDSEVQNANLTRRN